MISTLWQEARDAWLAEHPGPNNLDFPCRCKAQARMDNDLLRWFGMSRTAEVVLRGVIRGSP
jgi:hypothetical protein